MQPDVPDQQRTTLWDIPTRLFHWSIVVCVGGLWWSGENAEFDWHARLGYTVIVLVVFRLTWGVIGSRHSRFSNFLRWPSDVVGYLRGQVPEGAGHNPLGGWSVVALLLLLLIQGISGLFNTDDLLYQGPFYYAVSVDFRDNMGVIHEVVFNVLSGFIALHLIAIAYYQRVKKKPLLKAMVAGSAEGREGEVPAVSPWPALLIILILAVALWLVIGLAPSPPSLW